MAALKFAIDFDSAFTNVYKTGSGLVLSEPTAIAVNQNNKNEIKAFGLDARKLIGKTSENTKIIFPIFEGEIVNVKVAAKLLAEFLRKSGMESKLSNAHALFSVPCGSNAEMLKKYESVAKLAGISKVYFAETPILVAIGERIPLTDSVPCFVVDMAGGVTNIAALSLDGIIAGISVNVGANKICTDIIDYVAEAYGLQIGLLTAERLRDEIGSLLQGDTLSTIVNGRDVKTGVPKAVSLKAMDILLPTKRYYDKIAELVMEVLTKLPPEVSAEIRHSGIYISGLASRVYGLEQYYSEKFNVKINISENSSKSVALGGGMVISDKDLLKKVSFRLN